MALVWVVLVADAAHVWAGLLSGHAFGVCHGGYLAQRAVALAGLGVVSKNCSRGAFEAVQGLRGGLVEWIGLADGLAVGAAHAYDFQAARIGDALLCSKPLS